MKWRKSPEELISFLAEITKDINCQPRKMFGYPAYFINNNMFLCAFQENLIIRLSEKEKAKVLKQQEIGQKVDEKDQCQADQVVMLIEYYFLNS